MSDLQVTLSPVEQEFLRQMLPSVLGETGPVRIFVSMALPKGTVPFFWHPCHKNRDNPARHASRHVAHGRSNSGTRSIWKSS